MLARLALAGLFALASAGPAPADLIVSFGSASSVGNTVTVDVFVTGPERLDYFVGEFVVAPAPVGSAPASGLRFVNPPPLPPLTDPSYAFFMNSYAESLPLNPGGVTTATNPDDTYTVGDSTRHFPGVDVTSPRLLARLTLVADANLLGGPHDYTISLNPVGSRFEGPNMAPPNDPPEFPNLNFTGGSGTVTLQGNADAGGGQAVPEPGALVALALGLPALAGWVRSRRRAVPQ